MGNIGDYLSEIDKQRLFSIADLLDDDEGEELPEEESDHEFDYPLHYVPPAVKHVARGKNITPKEKPAMAVAKQTQQEISQFNAQTLDAPVKRGPGRPRKNPLPTPIQQVPSAAVAATPAPAPQPAATPDPNTLANLVAGLLAEQSPADRAAIISALAGLGAIPTAKAAPAAQERFRNLRCEVDKKNKELVFRVSLTQPPVNRANESGEVAPTEKGNWTIGSSGGSTRIPGTDFFVSMNVWINQSAAPSWPPKG